MFFSIIIPTYNRAHLILNTLDSVRNQIFKNYEVIIVDDGSNDNTNEIVENYIKSNNLKNWNYFYKINAERGAARNYGVSKATGIFITFLDSDDLFYYNHLQIAFDFIKKNNEIQLFHSAYEFKNPISNSIRNINYPKIALNQAILKGNILSCFGVFLKREIAVSHPFSENRKLSGSEDWLLWLQLLPNYTFYFQNIITGCMIEHEERSVLNFNAEELRGRADLLFYNLINNESFVARFGIKTVKHIYAHMLSYGALHLMLSGKRKESISMLILSIKTDYSILFQKRTLGILKNIYIRK